MRFLYIYPGKLWNREKDQEKRQERERTVPSERKERRETKIQLKMNFNDRILQWICELFDSGNGDNCFQWNQMKIQILFIKLCLT